MRLSEIITIYLATAAPFGVAHFQRGRGRVVRRLFGASCVALAWPLTAVSFLSETKAQRDACVSNEDVAVEETEAKDEERLERVRRALFDSLLRVEELYETARGTSDERARHAFFAARESVERYAGLTVAARSADLHAPPTPRELEMCRIAGRVGEDLLIAGRCLHRRNVIRLRLQRERARGDMLHALAEAGELVRESSPFASHAQAVSPDARRLCEALFEAYAGVVKLLSLLDDSAAALAVSRLHEAECARLRRRLEAQGAGDAKGDLCITQAATKPSARPTSESRTSMRAFTG
ncbi:MAG TPA: hypothetical protein VGV59_09390 [Pyrinomonadaceae bacterium]|nr:hypothetical protein [Pyrinomonadaceae bacterium]